METIEYIQPELGILIPALYLIGEAVKRSERIDDRSIPSVLGVVGAVLATLYVFGESGISASSAFTGIVQGVLCAGCAVYANQLWKQATRPRKG